MLRLSGGQEYYLLVFTFVSNSFYCYFPLIEHEVSIYSLFSISIRQTGRHNMLLTSLFIHLHTVLDVKHDLLLRIRCFVCAPYCLFSLFTHSYPNSHLVCLSVVIIIPFFISLHSFLRLTRFMMIYFLFLAKYSGRLVCHSGGVT